MRHSSSLSSSWSDSPAPAWPTERATSADSPEPGRYGELNNMALEESILLNTSGITCRVENESQAPVGATQKAFALWDTLSSP
ncbi:hypothetical protein Ct61P_15518 [Colletotrichum tofieldiae]|nr:hypothetical protein Ct61P_15518 [Colletotrichum tofieldiae]